MMGAATEKARLPRFRYLKYRVRTTPVGRYLLSEVLLDLKQQLEHMTMTITFWLPQQYTCQQVMDI